MSRRKRTIKINNPAPSAPAAEPLVVASDVTFPALAADLVSELDAIYPAQCILPGQSPEDAHRYAGKRELIDELLAWRDEDSKPKA